MISSYGKVVLLTGASSGIGKAAAECLAKNGFKVYGTSRKPGNNKIIKYENIPGGSSGFIEMVQLDVCSEQSVENAVNYVYQKEGEVNILLNCAGFGIAGSVEDTTAEEAYKQFDTNFFGALRMCRSIIPIMRNQKNGLIINISSVAGYISIPFQSMYSASKYALEAMTEALRMEVKPFGINVSIVEPGDTKTGFTDKREFTSSSKTNPAYMGRFEKAIGSMVKSETNGPNPDKVVKTISKIIESKNPPVRITVGFEYKAVGILKRILPSRFVEYVVSKVY